MPLVCLLSPAKTLDFDTPRRTDLPPTTQPRLLDDAAGLVRSLRRLSSPKLQALMGVSKDLADLNRDRFKAWAEDAPRDATRPAIVAFRGDVGRGFDVDTLDRAGLVGAQQSVRILSGLYGLLRPLDEILPYRLEMGTSFPTRRGKDLYAYWGDGPTTCLADDVADAEAEAIVNVASNEYAKVIRTKALDVPVVTPVFKERRDGKERSIALFSKVARGMMARFVAESGVDTVAGLRDFRGGGYRFRAKDSDDRTLVFTRKQPPPVGG